MHRNSNITGNPISNFHNAGIFDFGHLQHIDFQRLFSYKNVLTFTGKEKDSLRLNPQSGGLCGARLTVITYNPGKKENSDGKRLPLYGLSHELGHAYDAMNGKVNDEMVPVYKKGSYVTNKVIPWSEIRAVRFENRVRPANKQRRTYDGYDLTPYGVVVKKSDGTIL